MAEEISQEIVDIIVENKDKNDNEILGLIVGAGVAFGKAKSTLNRVLEEQGLRMTKAQRDEKAKELLSDFEVTEETTAEEVAEQVEVLVDELEIKPAAARAYIRPMFDEEELPMPKAERASSGPRKAKTPGFSGDVALSAEFALANPEAVEGDKEAFAEFMKGHNRDKTKSGKDKVETWYRSVVDLRIFGKKWQDAHCE